MKKNNFYYRSYKKIVSFLVFSFVLFFFTQCNTKTEPENNQGTPNKEEDASFKSNAALFEGNVLSFKQDGKEYKVEFKNKGKLEVTLGDQKYKDLDLEKANDKKIINMTSKENKTESSKEKKSFVLSPSANSLESMNPVAYTSVHPISLSTFSTFLYAENENTDSTSSQGTTQKANAAEPTLTLYRDYGKTAFKNENDCTRYAGATYQNDQCTVVKESGKTDEEICKNIELKNDADWRKHISNVNKYQYFSFDDEICHRSLKIKIKIANAPGSTVLNATSCAEIYKTEFISNTCYHNYNPGSINNKMEYACSRVRLKDTVSNPKYKFFKASDDKTHCLASEYEYVNNQDLKATLPESYSYHQYKFKNQDGDKSLFVAILNMNTPDFANTMAKESSKKDIPLVSIALSKEAPKNWIVFRKLTGDKENRLNKAKKSINKVLSEITKSPIILETRNISIEKANIPLELEKDKEINSNYKLLNKEGNKSLAVFYYDESQVETFIGYPYYFRHNIISIPFKILSHADVLIIISVDLDAPKKDGNQPLMIDLMLNSQESIKKLLASDFKIESGKI